MQERPRIMEWPKIEDIMGTNFQEAIIGEISVDKALDNMANGIYGVMKEAGFPLD